MFVEEKQEIRLFDVKRARKNAAEDELPTTTGKKKKKRDEAKNIIGNETHHECPARPL